MNARGSVVIGDHVLPVERVELERGRVMVIVRLEGPASRLRDQRREYRVHSSDGQLVCRRRMVIGWPKVAEGKRVWIKLGMLIGELETAPSELLETEGGRQ